MPSTRRKWIYGLSAATATAAADMFLVEPRWLSIETKRIQVLGGKLARPVRVVQLSDLHYSWCVSADMIRSAFLHALDQRPDLICLTGDFVTGASTVDRNVLTSLVKELSSRVPTYAVKGNHDGGSWARYYHGEKDDQAVEQAVARGGVQFLNNSARLIRIHGGEFWLAGVGDLWSEEVVAYTTFRDIPIQDRVVLMAHNPDTKDTLAGEHWDLMLSGHTHGTQTSISGLRERDAPVRDKRFIAGLCHWPEGNRWIHINRGVGNLGGFRILCPPEVSVLELV